MVAVIDSGAAGVDKPDPALFNLALDAAQATPDEAIHIGDSAWTDMEGARRASIAGIHISRSGICADESHRHARDLPGAVEPILG